MDHAATKRLRDSEVTETRVEQEEFLDDSE